MAHGLRRTAFDQSSYAYWTGQYGVVNVKDYGAVGDGVHDDTAAIQRAINAVAPQGILFFPQGIYKVSSIPEIPEQVEVEANGATIIATGVVPPGVYHFRNEPINVQTMFLASGSNNQAQGTIKDGSSQLTLNNPSDFQNGQGICIVNAGPLTNLPTPSAPTVTPVGTTGSTSYGYAMSYLDSMGGQTGASDIITITSGNTTLSNNNYNAISWSTPPSGTAAVAVYRVSSGGTINATGLIGVLPYTENSLNDTGLSITSYFSVSSDAPSMALGQLFIATIISGAGTNSLTLSSSALNSVTNTLVTHDDTVALQSAFNTINTGQGGQASGEIFLPTGTYQVTSPISLPHNGSTIIQGGPFARIFPMLPNFNVFETPNDGASDWIFNHLWIQQTGNIIPSTSGAAIALNTGGRILVNNLFSTNTYYGITEIGNVGTTMIVNSNISASHTGIYTQNGIQIVNSVISGNDYAFHTDSNPNTIDLSLVILFGQTAFYTSNSLGISNPNTGIICENVQANNDSNGIGFDLSYCGGEAHFTDCFSTGGTAALSVGSGFGTAVPVLTIKGGSWAASGGSAIQIQGGNGFLITGANVEGAGSGYSGIELGSQVSNVSITGNLFRGCPTGITLQGNSDYIAIHGNVFESSVGVPLDNSATGSHISVVANPGYNPVGAINPPASPLASGTVYQNTFGVPITIYQPAYATTSGTAGTVAVALGNSSSPGTLYTKQISGSTSSTEPDICTVRVPPGWYYSFTTSGATLLDAQIQGE